MTKDELALLSGPMPRVSRIGPPRVMAPAPRPRPRHYEPPRVSQVRKIDYLRPVESAQALYEREVYLATVASIDAHEGVFLPKHGSIRLGKCERHLNLQAIDDPTPMATPLTRTSGRYDPQKVTQGDCVFTVHNDAKTLKERQRRDRIAGRVSSISLFRKRRVT